MRHLPGITCFRSPIDYIEFNMAFVENENGINPIALTQVQGFYRDVKVEWCLSADHKLTGLFGKAMSYLRISRWARSPEMILKRMDFKPRAQHSALEVKKMKDVQSLREWVATAERGYEMTRGFMKLLSSKRALEIPGFTFLMGYDAGKPVAVSASFVSDGVAGVYAVGTVPEGRGRGYGEAMSAAAAQLGFDLGCEISSLQASQMGFPVYHRMGYRHVFDYQRWVVTRNAPEVRRV